MKVKIKKLSLDAIIPSYAKPGDAGMDLTAVSYEYDYEHDNHIYGTGLAIEIPVGYAGLIFPRSSNRKTSAYMTNHVGIIDSGYRGEIMVTFKQRDFNGDPITDETPTPYKVGDRIAQLIIVPYPYIELVEAKELTDTERGTGGHGSTGA